MYDDFPIKSKPAKTYRCYGGPMDGAEIEARKVFDSLAIENVQISPYPTGLKDPDHEFRVWEWAKEGCGDSVVKYRLEKGGRLEYLPPKQVPQAERNESDEAA